MMQQLMYARNPSRERFFTFFKGPPSSIRNFGFSLCQLRAELKPKILSFVKCAYKTNSEKDLSSSSLD